MMKHCKNILKRGKNTHEKTQRREVTKFGQAFQISSKTGGGVIRERGLTGMMTVPGRFFSESGHTTPHMHVLFCNP